MRSPSRALGLIESWTESPSDPPISEHTLLAIADGSGFTVTDEYRSALIALSPTSLDETGLVEMAGSGPERVADFWARAAQSLFIEARRRGHRELEVIDRGSLFEDSIGIPGRSVVRMVLDTSRNVRGDLSVDPSVGDPVPDFDNLVTLIQESFAGHPENGGWTVQDLQARFSQDWFDPAGFFVENVDGHLAGFCWTKIHPDGVGEIYLIAVDPGLGSRGLGSRLVTRALAYLQHIKGCQMVIVYLEGSNTKARRLYERSGFSEDRTDRRLRILL